MIQNNNAEVFLLSRDKISKILSRLKLSEGNLVKDIRVSDLAEQAAKVVIAMEVSKCTA